MSTTQEKTAIKVVITTKELLEHWQGHRRLTRKIMEAFPEKDFFNFSIGGMRPFSELTKELLSIAGPGVREIATGKQAELSHKIEPGNNKDAYLALWDETTDIINTFWTDIKVEQFHDKITAFGQYEGTILSTILYYIDNEIHHRGQGYVYLRALGIEPPFFWDRL